MFLDMGSDRNEVLVDKRGNGAVGIRFGLQPNTTASTRRCAEVEQKRPVPLPGLCESSIDIFPPLDSHDILLSHTWKKKVRIKAKNEKQRHRFRA